MRTSRADLDGSIPTADEWARIVDGRPKLAHLIEDIQPDAPGEYSIIGGRTGIGKTNLQMQMALSLATGTPFLGKRCEPVEVAMLAFEGPEQNLRERYGKLRKQFPDDEGRFHFEFLPAQSRYAMFETVKERLEKTPACRVAIIDSVKFIVDGDYLKSQFVVQFLEELKTHLAKIGMSAVIALPIAKPQNKGVLIDVEDVYEVKGCTEWVDPAITTILMERRYRKHKEHVSIGFPKTRIAVKDVPTMKMFFDKDRCLFVPDTGQCKSCKFKGDADDEYDTTTSVHSDSAGVHIRTVI